VAAKFQLRDEPGCLPVDGVQRAPIDLGVVGKRYGLSPTARQNTAQLNVTSSLCENLESESAQDLQDVPSGKDS